MAEPPPQPNGRDPAPKTTIHNHITKHSTTFDLSPLLSAFDAFLLSTHQCAYPQLIVTCRGQQRAFSRTALKEMGQKRAAQLLVARFARADDYVETPPRTGWFVAGAKRHGPAVEYLATFCRPESSDGVDPAPIPLISSPSRVPVTRMSQTTPLVYALQATFLSSTMCLPSEAERCHSIRRAARNCTEQSSPPRDGRDARIIAAAPTELARYDRELERLDAIFEQITEGRRTLQLLYDQCMSIVDAPVRRLPTEILVEIFHICAAQDSKSPSREPIPAHFWESEAKRELRRVAGGDLVSLEQVCVGWQRLVLGTPSLWSTITLDLRCWADPVDAHRAFWLHQDMVPAAPPGSGPCDSYALGILAQTSDRWRAASFTLDCADLKNLSDVRGLTLQGLNEDPAILAEVAQYFSDAPRLRRLEYCGPLGVVAHLPLQQLQSLRKMHVEINLAAVHSALPLELVPVVSSIGEFELESMEDYGKDSRDALSALFDAFTFPQIHQLKLFGMRDVYPYGPLYWPHPAALSLFQRSRSYQTLRSLAIPDVVITAAELLELLKELPSLIAPHLIIIDTLLRALTPTLDRPAQCMLPSLEIVDFRTLGHFTDDALGAFIRDRLNWRGRQAGFECAVLWLRGYPRTLGDETSGYFAKWKERGLQLACREFDRADDY
ncbi:hypothetical protein FB451DRAFT_1549558 [Mycena latifolia]|nr:hypothetical protein FB451DRAFT_1549558 [Mycena latifolia]